MPLYVVREPLVLASGSPRRRELLAQIGLDFQVRPSSAEEPFMGSRPAEGVRRAALLKARSVALQEGASWVLAADTIVVLGGHIFGKPSSPEEARNMLHFLAGRSHEVYSAVCLMRADRGFCRLEIVRSRVEFREVTNAEIDAYVRTGEPMDKAGAYGIQGLGGAFVRAVYGSYTNVVGLPLAETLGMLQKNGVIAPCVEEGPGPAL
ncbi:Maf family protein [Desulfosoma caldarium]|nr:Maf family protein [Desulfosoma caldarium]